MLPRQFVMLWLIGGVFTLNAASTLGFQEAADPAVPNRADSAPPPGAAAALSRRDLGKRLVQARRLLGEQQYPEGLAQLQRVLENPQDEYTPALGNEGGESSAKSTAEKLLSELPEEALEVYEKQNGPTAQRLLDEARRSFQSLDPIIDRFLLTRAGLEALYRQSSQSWEQGQPQLAIQGFERLLGMRRSRELFEPGLTLKAAIALRQLGETDRAVELIDQLRQRGGASHWELAGVKTPLPGEGATRKWLEQLVGPDRGSPQSDTAGWLLARGNRRRNGVASGGGPYLNHGWKVDVLAEFPRDSREGRLTEIARDQFEAGQSDQDSSPTVSLASPLIVRDLVIVRTLIDLRAYQRTTGQLVWSSVEKDRELLELLRPGNLPQSNQTQGTAAEQLVNQRFWSDVNFNNLSCDGERIYCVEDLGFSGVTLPHRVAGSQRDHNRLVAYDARSGRALWEAGGPRDSADDPLAGVFFLGAPLPWQGSLYAIVDLGSTPQLAVLHPRTGRVEIMQPLGADEPEWAGFDRTRWLSGLAPSCEGGILICPTGPDFVTAYDPGRRRLLWRYRFRPRTEAPDPRRMLQQQIARNGNGLRMEQSGWIDYGGVISGDLVLLSPRDSDQLYCLKLVDGSLVWKAPRGSGLYIGGIIGDVAVVVGRNDVEAVRMTDGTPAWKAPVSLPAVSGRGCVVDNTYIVPLTSGEVATIDVADGRILARSKSFSGQIPGSLAVHGGTFVSQRLDQLSGFRQVEGLQAEIAEALRVNPDHPESLAMRGQMRLERGEFGEALADLERAVTLAPDNAEARSLLLTALLEGLRVDFPTYHTFAPRVGQLVGHGQERSKFHWLMAQGFERLGNRMAAFEQLLEFTEPGVDDRDLERLDASLLIRRDRLVSVAAERLLREAPSAERDQLQDLLNSRAQTIVSEGRAERLRRFLRYFGTLLSDHRAALETRLAAIGAGDWLEQEFELRAASKGADEGSRGRLAARLGELLITAEKGRDLPVVAAWLEEKFPDAEVAAKTTGKALAESWKNRPDLQRFFASRPVWPLGRVEAERLPGVRPTAFGRTQPVFVEGPHDPFFSGLTLEMGMGDQLVARDGTGKPVWKLTLETPVWAGSPQFNRAWVRDHLLVLLIGRDLFGVDLLGVPQQPGPRWLWHLNLIDSSAAVSVQRGLANPRNRINFAPFGPDQTAVVGPVTQNHLVLLRGRRLSVVEPLTGQTIWMREGVAPGSGLFGDDELLFVAPQEAKEIDVLSMRDGTPVGVRRLPPAGWWLETSGRNLLLWGKPLDRQVLTLRDVWSDRDVWSHEFPVGSHVALVESEEAVVLEPQGRVVIIHLADGVVRCQAEVESVSPTTEIQVLRSRNEYLLIANRPLPNGPGLVRHSQNLHIAVNGRVHSLDRTTGRPNWSVDLERLQIDPQQPAETPLITFQSHIFEPRRAGNGIEQRFLLTCLDRRTGRKLYEDSRTDEPLHFIDYRIDDDAATIELQLYQSVVRFEFTDKPYTPE